MKQKTNSLVRRLLGAIVVPLTMVVFGGGLVFGAHQTQLFSPGELSGAQDGAETLGGYVSHAEFSGECGHCHAPIHCVSDTRCQDCHIDVARERASVTGLHSRLPGAGRCQTCHVEHQGADAHITEFAYANIDHERLSGFSLALHQVDYNGDPLGCESCHSQDIYIHESLDCVTCHAQADHAGYTERLARYGDDCLACHDGEDRYSDFEHDQVYLLDGAHLDLTCEDCHQALAYFETPSECSDCHAEPEVHADIFSPACGRCHTTSTWLPAVLVDHLFFTDHGDKLETNCESCHVGNYRGYSCDSCHAQAEMLSAHPGETAATLAGCADCHPTGVAGEAAQMANPGLDPLGRSANSGD